MPDLPNIATEDLSGLAPDERLGLDLLLEALREASLYHDDANARRVEALRGAALGLVDLSGRRRADQQHGPDPERTLTTLEAARQTLREHVLAGVEDLGDPALEHGGPGDVLALAKSYLALGGDLELEPAGESLELVHVRNDLANVGGERDRLRRAWRLVDDALLEVGQHGTDVLSTGVLEPLGIALREGNSIRQGRA